ncbi:MAG: hypothetical protein R3C03_00975 [Pirellulaceae bacterium]
MNETNDYKGTKASILGTLSALLVVVSIGYKIFFWNVMKEINDPKTFQTQISPEDKKRNDELIQELKQKGNNPMLEEFLRNKSEELEIKNK